MKTKLNNPGISGFLVIPGRRPTAKPESPSVRDRFHRPTGAPRDRNRAHETRESVAVEFAKAPTAPPTAGETPVTASRRTWRTWLATMLSMERIGKYRALFLDLFVIGCVALTGYVLIRSYMSKTIMVETIAVPDSFTKAGITPDVVNQQIVTCLHGLLTTAQDELDPADFGDPTDDQTPDIETPEGKLGIKAIIEYLGWQPERIRAEVHMVGNTPMLVVRDIPGKNCPPGSMPGLGTAAIPLLGVSASQPGAANRDADATPGGDPLGLAVKSAVLAAYVTPHPWLGADYYYHIGDESKAMPYVQVCLSNQRLDDDARAYNLRGLLLQKHHKFGEAEEQFGRSVEADAAYRATCGLFDSRRRRVFAYAQYNWAATCRAEAEEALLAGDSGEAIHQYHRAITRYQEAVRENPNYAWSIADLAYSEYSLAKVLATQKGQEAANASALTEDQSALADFDRAVAADPVDPTTRSSRAHCMLLAAKLLRASGQVGASDDMLARAEDQWNHALDADPKSDDALRGLGDLYEYRSTIPLARKEVMLKTANAYYVMALDQSSLGATAPDAVLDEVALHLGLARCEAGLRNPSAASHYRLCILAAPRSRDAFEARQDLKNTRTLKTG